MSPSLVGQIPCGSLDILGFPDDFCSPGHNPPDLPADQIAAPWFTGAVVCVIRGTGCWLQDALEGLAEGPIA